VQRVLRVAQDVVRDEGFVLWAVVEIEELGLGAGEEGDDGSACDGGRESVVVVRDAVGHCADGGVNGVVVCSKVTCEHSD
jgi:hypothetical protein